MNEHDYNIDKHIASVMAQITEAASKHDLTAIQRLSRKATELHELKQQLVAIQQRITILAKEEAGKMTDVDRPQSNGEPRKLPIDVTEGDIRQNLLKLTPYIRRGRIKVGEELMIEALPSGERFRTVVSNKGNKLRARGEIARFYREAKVNPGDFVLLTEETHGHWKLQKAPVGEYSRYA